ncbi:MAG TPA: DUF2795 domain-containing protein [Caldilineaceae bacterium]|nr:DUF2795 domain-containing protein [Caldilineaceae bacterium]
MPVEIKDQGQYELFETTKHHNILVLNGKRWFAAVRGQQSDILIQSDSNHQKKRTIQKGRFYAVEFRDDPKFKDMPHLFLEKDERYQELLIPNGLPTEQDTQKRVVWTDERIDKGELEAYLKEPAPAGPGEARMERPGGGSVANVAHYLEGINLPADKDEIIRYAQRKDAPQAVIEQLKQMGQGHFETMADVMKGIGAGEQPATQRQTGRRDERLPITGYDDLTVDEVVAQLDNLSRDELDRIRRYEEQHKHRKTILEAIERKR